jgi:hypothetical protein
MKKYLSARTSIFRSITRLLNILQKRDYSSGDALCHPDWLVPLSTFHQSWSLHLDAFSAPGWFAKSACPTFGSQRTSLSDTNSAAVLPLPSFGGGLRCAQPLFYGPRRIARRSSCVSRSRGSFSTVAVSAAGSPRTYRRTSTEIGNTLSMPRPSKRASASGP